MQYQKPAIDIAQQIQKLESRGLIITDKVVAAQAKYLKINVVRKAQLPGFIYHDLE